MNPSDIFPIIGYLSLFAVAISLVPTILQLRRALKKTEILVDSLNSNIDPLCKSLTEAATEFRILSASLNGKVEQTDVVLETAQKSADTLLLATTMVKDSVKPFITTVGGVGAGIKAFSYFLGKALKPPQKGE